MMALGLAADLATCLPAATAQLLWWCCGCWQEAVPRSNAAVHGATAVPDFKGRPRGKGNKLRLYAAKDHDSGPRVASSRSPVAQQNMLLAERVDAASQDRPKEQHRGR